MFFSVLWFFLRIAYNQRMQKKLLIFFLLSFLVSALYVYAAEGDIDGDGLPDEADLCPQVIWVRWLDGCPRVDAFPWEIALSQENLANVCYQEVVPLSSYFLGRAICPAGGASCLRISQGAGVQLCDVIFPVILNSLDEPMARWDLFFIR